ncbi:DUF4168 domain-containing protein [Hephaestia sp. GCM10023244]|uniref:DUF4168 domain-containing protein n=1 Tax=unclassified Hephaestia TaxID=2631281 RepID=UPI00207701DA|nr:DUF4168 domain-containing protein [Hephaestia sp. MAHUQ-44]MCM8730035.1 DUF4168 domain-containing protein [Hephaestia sp. MAHUQ-44]
MKTLLKTTMLAGACLMAAPALAQTSPADPAAPQSDPAAQAPQASASAGAVSDAEVDQFASAAVAVQKIGSDATVAEDAKQAKMAEAVQSSGLKPERFNEIAQASQADPALQARIQTAAQSKIKPGS